MSSISHLRVLDGWRGVSILLVLGAHLLPLGPNSWQLNTSAGIAGMAIFFVLSGFLITSILLKGVTVPEFLVRRFARVIPLAWLYLAIALAIAGAPAYVWLAHYLFYANLPPVALVRATEHIWSLCLEMQFYVGIAALVAVFRTRGLLLLPVLALVFTGIRIWNGVHVSSISYFRVDEILAGCTLALVYHGRLAPRVRERMRSIPQWLVLLLLLVSCHEQAGWLNYVRPYLAAVLVGATLLNPGTALVGALNRRVLAYLAAVSYALYVIHPVLTITWLGSGEGIEKYAKRPLLFAVLFTLAHLSTHYYERRWIGFGKRLSGYFTPALR